MMINLIKPIFWTFVLVLALSFFGISIQAILESPAGKANVAYIGHLLKELWIWATYWIRP